MPFGGGDDAVSAAQMPPNCRRTNKSLPFHRHGSIKLIVSSLFIAILVVAAKEEPTATPGEDGLVIHNTFKPDACDRKAKTTDVLTLHYKGYLEGSEQVFDSSYERNEAFTFQLGIGHVILGWERGLVGVCVGEKRQLIVPPHLGYGDAKHDQIPPKSTLVFDIEILKIEDGPVPANVFKEIDTDSDGRLSRKEVGEFLRKQLSQGQQHGDTGSPDDPDRVQMIDEIFMHEDKDKDDYITHEEFSGPKHDHGEL